MGGFAAVAPMVMQAGMQVAQMHAQQSQAKAAAEAQAGQQALQSQALWQQQEQRARQQRDLMKRQLASARASLAGGGLGLSGGSGQALMEGLARRTEQDIADGYGQASLRHQLQFGDGEDRARPDRLVQGLQLAQQGFAILRPKFS